MQALKLVVRIFCLLPFVTGTLDLVTGVRILKRVAALDRRHPDTRAVAIRLAIGMGHGAGYP